MCEINEFTEFILIKLLYDRVPMLCRNALVSACYNTIAPCLEMVSHEFEQEVQNIPVYITKFKL